MAAISDQYMTDFFLGAIVGKITLIYPGSRSIDFGDLNY